MKPVRADCRLSTPASRLSAPAGATAEEAQTIDRMKLFMSGLTIVSLPVAASMPSSVLLFWISNNCFSLAYTSVLQVGAARSALGLPPRPEPYTPENAAPSPGALDAAPIDQAKVGIAQLRTVDSLAALADSMRAAGKLKDAIGMQQRALALCVEAVGEADDAARRAGFALARLQLLAGKYDEATATLERWKAASVLAGETEAKAAERAAALVAEAASDDKPPTER